MASADRVSNSIAKQAPIAPASVTAGSLTPACPLCGYHETKTAFRENACELRACSICGLFFVHPYPDGQTQHGRVSSGANSEIEILSCESRHQGERLYYQRHLPLIAEECRGANSLLDVGCGTGYLLECLSNEPGIYTAGIELNAEAARFARRVTGRPIYEVPLEDFRSDRKFDVITLINVFSHIPSFDGMFRAMRAALRPGGKIILRTSEMSANVSRWNQVHWGIPDDLHFLGLGTADFLCAKYGMVVARHIRTPFEEELFRRSRWEQMGRNRIHNAIKKVGVRVPLALPALKKLYRTSLGQRLFVSFIVLKPLERETGTRGDAVPIAARLVERRPETASSRAPIPAATPAKSPFLIRTIRSEPHVYSALCRGRLLFSRRIAGSEARGLYQSNRGLFAMNELEKRSVEALRNQGYALEPAFFPPDLIDRIFAKASVLFRELQIDDQRSYSIQTRQRANLRGLTYDEIAATEKVIALRDPLIRIPEVIQVAFHESVLKIAANFLGYVPPLYRVTVVRDFPHNRPLHSSNFHKDNDEADSLQIFIYLVDIDRHRGPLVYIPGSNHHDVRSCRPRLSRDLGLPGNDGRLCDEEVERVYPRDSWAVLNTSRGSIAAIHGNGIHKGPAWTDPCDPENQPRTAIKLDLHGYKKGVRRDFRENLIRAADFEQMTELQRLFAHATIVQDGPAMAANAE
jgi:SAM-dependent methyltransferase